MADFLFVTLSLSKCDNKNVSTPPGTGPPSLPPLAKVRIQKGLLSIEKFYSNGLLGASVN
jgi:hypothetical protein